MTNVSSENFKKQQAITNEIDRLLRNVHNDTAAFSIHYHIFEHEDFKKLVEMGDRIIPYLFHKITHYGGSWVVFILFIKSQN